MTKSTKYVHLIGIERKEALLVQSFINLINEDFGLNYQIDAEQNNIPELFVVDELFHHDQINVANPKAAMLIVGNDINNPEIEYLHRPIQWSRFKSNIALLNKDIANKANTVAIDLTQVVEVDGAYEDQHGDTPSSSNINIDAKTNKEKVEGISSIEAPRAELSAGHFEDDHFEISNKDIDLADHYEGIDRLGANIEFWEEDNCQVIVSGKPSFFVLPQKKMVYSEYPMNDWEILLRSRDARKAFLPENWQPTERMKAFPIRWLTWFSGHARSKGYLLTELNKDHFFVLDKWPEFDLLYNNNEHLKLCGLIFQEGRSIQELVSKTHVRARIIIGLINSCHKLGVLSSFPDKDSSRPKINSSAVDTHTVISLLSKVFKT